MDNNGGIVASVFLPTRLMFNPRARENLSVAMYSIPGNTDSKAAGAKKHNLILPLLTLDEFEFSRGCAPST
jgi:hypothetical protein